MKFNQTSQQPINQPRVSASRVPVSLVLLPLAGVALPGHVEPPPIILIHQFSRICTFFWNADSYNLKKKSFFNESKKFVTFPKQAFN